MKYTLFVTAAAVLLTIVSAQESTQGKSKTITYTDHATQPDRFIKLKNTLYQDESGSKNIAFFAAFGGSSHTNWVLTFMDELATRGHNITFLTSNEMTHFGKPYSQINTVPIGPIVQLDVDKFMKDSDFSSRDPAAFMALGVTMMQEKFEQYYHFTRDYFIKNKIDVALCDHFADSCVEAAMSVNIPYIITTTVIMSEESSAPYTNDDISIMIDPTTEFQSFSTRFYDRLIHPLRLFTDLRAPYQQLNAKKAAVTGNTNIKRPIGVTSELWKDSLKIINNLFGFVAPRPMDPLTELVGPILPSQYKPLTPELETFLDVHHRVAYVAFGQMATPSESEIKVLLTTLMDSLERGYIDGLIWATVHSAGRFPDTITTTYSNTTYDVPSLFKGSHPDVRLIKWAPQTAILNHPSSLVFVSHGGQTSWYESMYSGTRMIMFPFFGDQPANARTMERFGLGGRFDPHKNFKEILQMFERVMMDPNDEVKQNVQRTQALMQIHSRRAVARAADLVEEVAFSHKNGKLPHRETANRRMSFIKAHNLDIYGAAAAIILTIGFVLTALIKSLLIPILRRAVHTSVATLTTGERKLKAN